MGQELLRVRVSSKFISNMHQANTSVHVKKLTDLEFSCGELHVSRLTDVQSSEPVTRNTCVELNSTRKPKSKKIKR